MRMRVQPKKGIGAMEKKIEEGIKKAMRERDEVTLSTLRMLKSAIDNMKIKNKVKELKDGEILPIISLQIKQHMESIEQFKKGSRQDLVEKEERELAILKRYLPEQLSLDRIRAIVHEAANGIDAADKSAFGKIMKEVMAKTQGQADGKVVSKLVNERLAEKNG